MNRFSTNRPGDPGASTASGVVSPKMPVTVWALGVVSLLMDVSAEMVHTLMPLFLVAGLGASPLAVGVIEGLAVAIATATRFLAGIVADWMGRNKSLAVLGYGLAALSRLIFPVAASTVDVAIGRSLDRLGKGLRSAPRDALIAGITPEPIRGAAFGLRKSLDTVGGFVGPLLAVGGLALWQLEIRTVFWLATVPAVLAVLVLLFAVREPRVAEIRKTRLPRLADIGGLGPSFRSVMALASLITFARFSEAFVLLKSLDAGFATACVPLAMVLMHAVFGLAAYPVGRLSDRLGPRGLLACGLGFLLVAHVLLAMSTSVLPFLIGTLFWGLHMGFSQGLLASMVAATSPDHLRGTAFGTFSLLTGAVVLVGNILCGWLWQGFGADMPFWAGAGVTVGCLGLMLWQAGDRDMADG